MKNTYQARKLNDISSNENAAQYLQTPAVNKALVAACVFTNNVASVVEKATGNIHSDVDQPVTSPEIVKVSVCLFLCLFLCLSVALCVRACE